MLMENSSFWVNWLGSSIFAPMRGLHYWPSATLLFSEWTGPWATGQREVPQGDFASCTTTRSRGTKNIKRSHIAPSAKSICTNIASRSSMICDYPCPLLYSLLSWPSFPYSSTFSCKPSFKAYYLHTLLPYSYYTLSDSSWHQFILPHTIFHYTAYFCLAILCSHDQKCRIQYYIMLCKFWL